jgi:hypothetical protein
MGSTAVQYPIFVRRSIVSERTVQRVPLLRGRLRARVAAVAARGRGGSRPALRSAAAPRSAARGRPTPRAPRHSSLIPQVSWRTRTGVKPARCNSRRRRLSGEVAAPLTPCEGLPFRLFAIRVADRDTKGASNNSVLRCASMSPSGAVGCPLGHSHTYKLLLSATLTFREKKP